MIRKIDQAIDKMSLAIEADIHESNILFNIYIHKAKKVAKRDKTHTQKEKANKAIALFTSIIEHKKLQDLIKQLQAIKDINALITKEISPRKFNQASLSLLCYSAYINEIANLCVAQLRSVKCKYKDYLHETHDSLLPLWYDREIANSIDLFVFSVTKNYKNFEGIFQQIDIDYADLAFLASENRAELGDIWGLKVVLRMVANRFTCPEQHSILEHLFPSLKVETQTTLQS